MAAPSLRADPPIAVVGTPKLKAGPHDSTSTLVVVVHNDGPDPVVVTRVDLFFADEATAVSMVPKNTRVAGNTVTTLRLEVKVGARESGDADLVLYTGEPAGPSLATATFTRQPSQIDIQAPVLSALALSAVIVVVASRRPRRSGESSLPLSTSKPRSPSRTVGPQRSSVSGPFSVLCSRPRTSSMSSWQGYP